MFRAIAIALIRFYQQFISPLKAPTCRFHPSCSCYAREAIERHGLCRGLLFALGRLGRCHPWHPGGYDPVR
jgi:putative membrane protein insertion efficiency factor